MSVEATAEHPFFVIGQGWSSCNSERTENLYGLPCQRLQVGDVCISLTQNDETPLKKCAERDLISCQNVSEFETNSAKNCNHYHHQHHHHQTKVCMPWSTAIDHDGLTGSVYGRHGKKRNTISCRLPTNCKRLKTNSDRKRVVKKCRSVPPTTDSKNVIERKLSLYWWVEVYFMTSLHFWGNFIFIKMRICWTYEIVWILFHIVEAFQFCLKMQTHAEII